MECICQCTIAYTRWLIERWAGKHYNNSNNALQQASFPHMPKTDEQTTNPVPNTNRGHAHVRPVTRNVKANLSLLCKRRSLFHLFTKCLPRFLVPDFPLLVPMPFQSLAHLCGMTFPFISDRNPPWTSSNQTSGCFFFQNIDLPSFLLHTSVFLCLKSLFVVHLSCVLSFVLAVYSCVCVCTHVCT